MSHRFVFACLLAGGLAALPATLAAQQWPPPPPPAKSTDRLPRAQQPQQQQPEIEELTPRQIQRAQEPEPPAPAPQAAPRPAPKAAKHTASSPPRAITCSGPFAKDSSHLKLATVYNSQNITFAEVDGPDGAKIMASVLFPKDPKRRLEVWWNNEAARMDTYLIVINGQSTWAAPKGVKLGLQLAALEKINHKPFKLKGLDKENGSQVSDWDGGALAQLPGGCKVGVRLTPDAKAAPDAREAVSGNKDFMSSDAAIRAVKPKIAEIILGY